MSTVLYEPKLARSSSDRIFDTVIFILLTGIFLQVAYPLYFIIISSVSSPSAVAGGDVVWIPVGFSLAGYQAVLEEKTVMRGFANALFYTFVGTSINLMVTIPTAYALSRDDFFGRKAVNLYYIITMFIGGGLIPTYIVVRAAGFIDSVWALTVPGSIPLHLQAATPRSWGSTLQAFTLDATRPRVRTVGQFPHNEISEAQIPALSGEDAWMAGSRIALFGCGTHDGKPGILHGDMRTAVLSVLGDLEVREGLPCWPPSPQRNPPFMWAARLCSREDAAVKHALGGSSSPIRRCMRSRTGPPCWKPACADPLPRLPLPTQKVPMCCACGRTLMEAFFAAWISSMRLRAAWRKYSTGRGSGRSPSTEPRICT